MVPPLQPPLQSGGSGVAKRNRCAVALASTSIVVGLCLVGWGLSGLVGDTPRAPTAAPAWGDEALRAVLDRDRSVADPGQLVGRLPDQAHFANGGRAPALPFVPPGSDAEIRQRYWQSQRMCIFALVGESNASQVFEEASVAMRAWGDHRTFLTTFAPGLLKAAKEVHSLMARAAAGNASLLREPEEWVAAATALAAKQDDTTPPLHSPVPPTMLLVPPSVPPPGTEGGRDWSQLRNEPRGTRIARVIKAAAEQQRRAMEGRPWTLRAAEDAVILLDPTSVFANVLLKSHVDPGAHPPEEKRARWLSKEGKSLLTWDYITRMLRWRGRADGAEAGGPGGFSECEWVMKADTDTVVNRASLRATELVFVHGGNPRTELVYSGLVMGFGSKPEFSLNFQFGGLGYYFSRAALELIRGHPFASFRTCSPLLRLIDAAWPLNQVEDGVVGGCVTLFRERYGLPIPMPNVPGRRVSIGNRTSMTTSYLARRHHCTCCPQSMHKVGAEGQRLARRVLARNCISAPRPALYTELGVLTDQATRLCSHRLIVGRDRHTTCPVVAFGDQAVSLKALGIDGPASDTFSEPADLAAAENDVDGPNGTYPL